MRLFLIMSLALLGLLTSREISNVALSQSYNSQNNRESSKLYLGCRFFRASITTPKDLQSDPRINWLRKMLRPSYTWLAKVKHRFATFRDLQQNMYLSNHKAGKAMCTSSKKIRIVSNVIILDIFTKTGTVHAEFYGIFLPLIRIKISTVWVKANIGCDIKRVGVTIPQGNWKVLVVLSQKYKEATNMFWQ